MKTLTLAAGMALAATSLGAHIDGAHRFCAHRMHARGPGGVDDRSGHYDAATGRSLLNYPPHRDADLLHMRLEITIADMNDPRFDARETLSFTPIAEEVAELGLDASGMQIRSVSSPMRRASFEHDGERLVVRLDPPVAMGERAILTIDYAATDPGPGMVWTPERLDIPGRPASLHTLGQSEWNRRWFITHDFPNERLTSELIVAVPAGFEVISNGRLTLREPGWLASSRGEMEIFHWVQDKDHVPYLVSLVVGKFDTVDVGTRRVPMPVSVPLGRGDDVKGTYGRTREMVEVFQDRFDEPYPWDRYAQVLVDNFAAGGMEHTAATTMYGGALIPQSDLDDSSLEDLISHELAHQWFGDLLTCRSWEHIWLNEGFATYAEALWVEHTDGKSAALEYALGWLDAIEHGDGADAPFQPAMASKEYASPDDTFGREADAYSKGGLVLHMLRTRLGDEVFFRAVAEYIDRFKFGLVETNDFRKVLEEVSGESLERFFAQWVYRPGLPQIAVEWQWNPLARRIDLSAEQLQNIDGFNPAFALDLPLYIGFGDGSGVWFTLSFDTQEFSTQIKLPQGEPAFIAADPHLACASILTVEQAEPAWIAQLQRGPTVLARIRAARALAVTFDAPSLEALRSIAASETEPRALRIACIESLAAAGDIAGLADLAHAAPADPCVRAAIAEHASTAAFAGDPASLQNWLVHAARTDTSTRVRAQAVRALAHLYAPEAFDIALDAAATASFDDRLHEAAIEALEWLDDARALPIVHDLARAGNAPFIRAHAMQAMASLAHHAPDEVWRAILANLNDREVATGLGAAEALAQIDGAKALPELEKSRDAARDPSRRRSLQDLIDRTRALHEGPRDGES